MIILILGGIGSGKSVTATRFIKQSCYYSFCNFKVKHPNATRIRKSDIIQKDVVEIKKSGNPVHKYSINWDYWNHAKEKHGGYNIVLDEVHNLVHSRQSMTRWNTMMSMWISQVRKILGDSERTHVVLVSQKMGRIDIAFRELAHKIIVCKKMQTGNFINTRVLRNGRSYCQEVPETFILQYHFLGDDCVAKHDLFMMGHKTYDFRNVYYANPIFQFYDSYEIFGETDYL